MTIPFKRNLGVKGKSPHVVHQRTSYPILVRDGIFDRIENMSFFSEFTFGKTSDVHIQQESLPYCGVYLLQEQMAPDGDANVGEVRFRTTARFGFSIIIRNNDSEKAEILLDKASQIIMIGLFSDHTLYDNDKFKIQAFSSGTRQHVFGAIGKNQETPVAELRMEMSCDLGVISYPPYVPDDLEVIHVKTAFPVGGTAQEHHDTQQVETQYDVDQGS